MSTSSKAATQEAQNVLQQAFWLSQVAKIHEDAVNN